MFTAESAKKLFDEQTSKEIDAILMRAIEYAAQYNFKFASISLTLHPKRDWSTILTERGFTITEYQDDEIYFRWD